MNIFQIVVARAINPIPGPEKARLSNLLESEKDHVDDYSNKLFKVLKLQRELDQLLKDAQIKRQHLEELQGECINASRRFFEVEHTILERIGVLRSSSSRGLRRIRGGSRSNPAFDL